MDAQWVCHTADSTSCDLSEGDVTLKRSEAQTDSVKSHFLRNKYVFKEKKAEANVQSRSEARDMICDLTFMSAGGGELQTTDALLQST